MVAGGVGCTLLPALAAQTDNVGLSALIRVLRFVPPEPSRTIGLVFRRQFPHQEVIQHLYALIKAHLPAPVRQTAQRRYAADKTALRQEAALCQTALNEGVP